MSTTRYIEDHVPVVKYNGLNTNKTATFSGAVNFTGAVTYTGSKVGGTQNVISTAATLTAAQSGTLCVMGDLTGTLYTLPAASAGLSYEFFVSVANTSGSHKVITPASVFLLGSISYGIVDTTPAANPGPKFTSADGSTIRSIAMNGSTTGGVAGTYFTVKCISATQWMISGLVIASGTISTPFATS